MELVWSIEKLNFLSSEISFFTYVFLSIPAKPIVVSYAHAHKLL
jgi:hypothetical protein